MTCVAVTPSPYSCTQSQRQCYDVYVVHLEPVEPVADNEGLESKWIIPSVNQNGSVTLNVTTNSTLSTNMFYRATLITAVDMMEAGRFQFCKYTTFMN